MSSEASSLVELVMSWGHGWREAGLYVTQLIDWLDERPELVQAFWPNALEIEPR